MSEVFGGFLTRINDLADDLSAAGMRWRIQVEDPENGYTAEYVSEKRPRR